MTCGDLDETRRGDLMPCDEVMARGDRTGRGDGDFMSRGDLTTCGDVMGGGDLVAWDDLMACNSGTGRGDLVACGDLMGRIRSQIMWTRPRRRRINHGRKRHKTRVREVILRDLVHIAPCETRSRKLCLHGGSSWLRRRRVVV